MKNTLIITVLFLLNIGYGRGQELANEYYNYILNKQNLNPAFIGHSGDITAILNAKTYMAGYSGAPRNIMFGLDVPITNQQGLGARLTTDKRGAYELSKYDISYSHELQIDESSTFRFGISGGAIRRMLNPNSIDNIEFLEQADPTLASGYYDETKFTSGVGLLYEHKKLQLGLSAPHLLVENEDISQFMVGMASYRIAIKDSDFSLEPSLIYQNRPVLENTLDVLVRVDYQEQFWTQLGYQSTNNLNFALGFNFGAFGVGYAYGRNNQELSRISSNSNEIMIRLNFASLKKKHENELIKTLDEYVARFDAMLDDENNNYSRSTVMAEIKNMRLELSKLESSNNKKTAKKVDKKLSVIEEQIKALEIKYGKQ